MRLLKKNEIEVRVGSINGKGCSLLLYKNARVDMQMLDEAYGELGWKREHIIINGTNYCRVSVYNEKTKEWISKEDCGTESMTEKEKGLASDAFKRACVNWGIGRELYTSPFIWVANVELKEDKGKYKTYDKFYVASITYNEDREIETLKIVNQNNIIVFEKGNNNLSTEKVNNNLSTAQLKRLFAISKQANKSNEEVSDMMKNMFNKESSKDLTRQEYDKLCDKLQN